MEPPIQPEQTLNASHPGIPDAEKRNGSATATQEASNANPPTAMLVSSPQRWNHPRINMWRSFASFFGFVIMGLNDSAYGALIPYLEEYYNVSYTVVSLVFLSPLVGYTASAMFNNSIHMTFGQRGVAFIAPGVRVIAYVIISQHPPYPALVIVFILAGFSNGLEDAAWNAWMGIMQNANEILGFLHGAFGLGATLGPLIATTMITKAHLGWYTFYYIMVGLSAVELVTALAAFWQETGRNFQNEHPRTSGKTGGRTREALGNRVTWICSVFLLIYVGIEVAVGGWVVVFMMRVRHAAPFAAGMGATGFWLGITIGRLVLGFVTPRVGEKLAIVIYLALATALHLIFYLVPSLGVSFAAVSLVGFFLGPMFPASVVAATKLLPPHLHVAGIGFAAAFGSAGACVLPFAVGAIAQAKGVQVLMPIVLACLVADAVTWSFLPGLGRRQRKKGPGDAVQNGASRDDALEMS